jgi:hypothetical protein
MRRLGRAGKASGNKWDSPHPRGIVNDKVPILSVRFYGGENLCLRSS